MSINAQTWKVKRAVGLKRCTETQFLEGLTSDETTTTEGLIIFILENDEVT